jgi:phosphate transport system substrate-binding protein
MASFPSYQRRAWLRALAGAAATTAWPLAQAQESVLRIGGTGTGSGIMTILGAEYAKSKPGMRTQIAPALGSSGGIRAVTEGAIDLAVLGRSPTADGKSADAKGAVLDSVPFADTAFVIAVHVGVPTNEISLAALARLYADEQATWPDRQRVRLVLRPPDDGDNKSLRDFSPAIAAAVDAARQRPGMLVAATDRDCADAIERSRGGLGTSTLGLILAEKRQLKVLKLEGKQPSLASIEDGSYPHKRRIHLAWRTNAPAAVREFVAFLQSARAGALLRENGFAPLNK